MTNDGSPALIRTNITGALSAPIILLVIIGVTVISIAIMSGAGNASDLVTDLNVMHGIVVGLTSYLLAWQNLERLSHTE